LGLLPTGFSGSWAADSRTALIAQLREVYERIYHSEYLDGRHLDSVREAITALRGDEE
jgi:hypothetical protein